MFSGYTENIPPFLSFLWSGKGQEENRHGVEGGTVARAARSSSKGRNTMVCHKSPNQSQNPLRYASSSPSTLRGRCGGWLSSRGSLGRKGTPWTRSLFACERRATKNKSTVLPWRPGDCILPTPSLPRYLLIHMYTHLCPGILLKDEKNPNPHKSQFSKVTSI